MQFPTSPLRTYVGRNLLKNDKKIRFPSGSQIQFQSYGKTRHYYVLDNSRYPGPFILNFNHVLIWRRFSIVCCFYEGFDDRVNFFSNRKLQNYQQQP